LGDRLHLLLWIGVLLAGLSGGLLLRRIGLAATYVRDLLHVGAGTWVLGWPFWRSWIPPSALAIASAGLLAAAPLLARRAGPLRHLVTSMSGGDEEWGAVALYGASFAGLTLLGLGLGVAFPAAGALLALALGDGIGGLVGRRFGRVRYAAPGGKTKSLEGSAAVALGAGLGVALAAAWLGERPGALAVAGAGVAASLAEGLSPRATDNAFVPGVVYAFLAFVC
jgi:dolichol kinase